jgi:hypothetical protein
MSVTELIMIIQKLPKKNVRRGVVPLPMAQRVVINIPLSAPNRANPLSFPHSHRLHLNLRSPLNVPSHCPLTSQETRGDQILSNQEKGWGTRAVDRCSSLSKTAESSYCRCGSTVLEKLHRTYFTLQFQFVGDLSRIGNECIGSCCGFPWETSERIEFTNICNS